MTSSNGRQGRFLANGPVYALLAIYMPMAALAALVFLLRTLLPFQPAILIICGGLSALAATFYCDFMKDVKSNRTNANMRGAIIILAIFYIFASLFRWGIPWRKRLLPDLSNVLASVGALYVWISVISLKNFFSVRKLFEGYTELYQGEQLHKALFEDSFLLQNLDKEISKTEKRYLFQIIIIGLVLFLNLYNKIHISPALYLFLILILASGLGIYGFFEIIRREQYYAAEGMSLPAADRSRHIVEVVLFSIFPIIAAILLASDKNLLPFSPIFAFFNWLLGLFRLLTSSIMGYDLETSDPMPYFEQPSSPFEPFEDSEPWPIWTWLKYIFIVVAAVGFLWFMISPLFDRGGKKLSIRRRLIRIIKEWFKGTLTALASFFTFITGGTSARKIHRPSAEAIQRTAGAVFGAYSPAKKRALKQSVTLFARLIIWGGEIRRTAWKPVHAPGEYCGILTASALDEHELNQKIIRCGELFEKALYSADVLSDLEQKEFKGLIEEITTSQNGDT